VLSDLSSIPSGDAPILATERLGRVSGAVTLVSDVSIHVAAHELLAVVGPSGSGKSSFLRLLNRLDEPTSDTVYVDGENYRQIPPQELRRRVGW
jgi:putative ABC transport system ATP-binding protein